VPHPLISLRGVTKCFGEGAAAFEALRGIDLDIDQGDFVAVMGPSGSGKSTTMNILGCLDVPTTGSFKFKGVHVEGMDRDQRSLIRRRYFGFVFQGFNLLARTTALENVELPLLYRGESAPKRHKLAMAALDRVGLADWASHTPAKLSGGQQQRVAIARALVTQPDVILADEPTGNLDSERSAEIMQLLAGLNRDGGITLVIVTHDPNLAKFSRTLIYFKDGLIEEQKNMKIT
jgi:putative ABC transport system ATP-binding protein